MASKTSQSAANSYAAALLQLANSANQAEAAGDEILQIKEILASSPSFSAYLRDPAVGKTQRAASIESTFKGKTSGLVWNLIGVMNSKGRLADLPAVADAYQKMLDQQLGKMDVQMTVATSLDAGLMEEVRQKVSKALGKSVVLKEHINESIIGGFILRVEDKLLDASVRTQLERIKRKLIAARPAMNEQTHRGVAENAEKRD